MDLALNNQQRMICHKIQTTKPIAHTAYSVPLLFIIFFFLLKTNTTKFQGIIISITTRKGEPK